MDISSFADRYQDKLVENLWKFIYRELKSSYPDISDIESPVPTVLTEVYRKSNRSFVIIIDEWDCVIRNQADRQDLVHEFLQFLHALFKSEEAKNYLALAYITGILPIKKIHDESALNNFREYTMINSGRLAPFFGFTEEEVKSLCMSHGMDFESVRTWYNGYLINGKHMYNPNSVYQAMIDQSYNSYWKNTSAFSTINEYITLNYDGLQEDILAMLEGEKVSVNVSSFSNDLTVIRSKDEALTALIHLGYLGYDADDEEAYIPNFEVSEAYRAALQTGSWKKIADSLSTCNELLRATIKGDETKVAELVELAHETYTSVLQYNNENSLSCCLTMAYFTAPAYYSVIREMPAGKGFADLVFLPRRDSGNKPAMIIELKYNESADTAIRQIKEKRYAGALKDYSDEILLVGIRYGKDKKHSCLIEKTSFE